MHHSGGRGHRVLRKGGKELSPWLAVRPRPEVGWSPAGLVRLQPCRPRTPPGHPGGETPGSPALRSAPGGVCVALTAPSRRAGPAPSLAAPRRAEPSLPGGLRRSQRPPGRPVRRGAAGRAGGSRGAGGGAARRLGSRPRPAEPGGAGQGEAAEGGPAPVRRLFAPPAAARRPGAGEPRAAAGAERGLRSPCAPPRPPSRAAPPLALLASPPPPGAALPPAPGPPTPVGPGGPGTRAPSPLPPGIGGVPTFRTADRGAGQRGPLRPLRTPRGRERGPGGARQTRPGRPAGPAHSGPAGLNCTRRIRGCAEGIPAPPEPSDFSSRAGTGQASLWSPCDRLTCGLAPRARQPLAPSRRGCGRSLLPASSERGGPRPLPPPRCLSWRLGGPSRGRGLKGPEREARPREPWGPPNLTVGLGPRRCWKESQCPHPR